MLAPPAPHTPRACVYGLWARSQHEQPARRRGGGAVARGAGVSRRRGDRRGGGDPRRHHQLAEGEDGRFDGRARDERRGGGERLGDEGRDAVARRLAGLRVGVRRRRVVVARGADRRAERQLGDACAARSRGVSACGGRVCGGAGSRGPRGGGGAPIFLVSRSNLVE